MLRACCCFLALGCAWSPVVAADEIVFKNGDRLTGRIVRLEEGKLTFKSTYAGEVRVHVADLASFGSEQPLDVRLADGSAVRARVGDGRPGGAADAPRARTVAAAEVRAINPKEGWSGSASAGLLATRGNSNADNANAAFDVEKRRVRDRFTAGAAYLFGRQRDPSTGEKTTTTDNWRARAKYDHFFSPRLYVYGNTAVEKDNIAHLDFRLTPGVGVGHQIVERADLKASIEGGVTYVYEKFAAPDDASTTEFRDHNEYVSGRLAYRAEKRFGDRVTAFHNGEYLPSFRDVGDYLVKADGGMRVGLTAQLFLEYKLTLTYDAVPAPGASNTDLRHLLSVGWQF